MPEIYIPTYCFYGYRDVNYFSETACAMYNSLKVHFGSVLTTLNKVSGRIVYIVDFIIF